MPNDVTLEAIKAFVQRVIASQKTIKYLFELETDMYLFSSVSEYHNLRAELIKEAEALGINAISQKEQGIVVSLLPQVFENLNLKVTNSKDEGIFLSCESNIGDMILVTYRLQLDISAM